MVLVLLLGAAVRIRGPTRLGGEYRTSTRSATRIAMMRRRQLLHQGYDSLLSVRIHNNLMSGRTRTRTSASPRCPTK